MSFTLCKTAINVLSKHCLKNKILTHLAQTRHGAAAFRHQVLRTCSAAAIAAAPAEGEQRDYPKKIRTIVDQISQLSLLEVADLNELLKKTLRITDAPVMAAAMLMAAPGAAPKQEEEAQATFVQMEFTVSLTKFDDTKKVALIKAIKNVVSGLNLVQAKKFVESAPQVIKADISKEEAEKIKKELEEVGATIVIE